MSKAVYAIATMDTKGEEIMFVANALRAARVEVKTVDVGTLASPTVRADISRDQVLLLGAGKSPDSLGSDRGQAVSAMSEALRAFVLNESMHERVAGVIGIGGSGGTAIITTAMRALPIGLPKMMVSTMASGNVAPYVDCSDITMMYSVVDIAGLNAVSRRVLGNAAHAMAGMVSQDNYAVDARPTLGMTMFGVTTECVSAVREQLESKGYDCLVFHATGSGGRAMEKLVASGLIQGVLDLTTTEVADEVVGGVMPAGQDRFDITIEKQIPFVLSLGALDMVNFGAAETVPSRFKGRKLHIHNAQVTLMRTSAEENRQFARWIANKLNRATAPVIVLIPEQGLSMIDAAGQPFFDPAADAALFDELELCLKQDSLRKLIRLPYHINDAAMATAMVNAYLTLTTTVEGN
ncbi:MAG: Tm-1-like ATP-binding domain-containing protein [Pirellulaceae bacterium]